MLCLSVRQPWASLIVLGVKKYETRKWHREVRGRIGIHAAKAFPDSARRLCETEPFLGGLLVGGFRCPADLPRQAIIGTVELLACRPAAEVRIRLPSEAAELLLGDFRASNWAYELARPIRLARAISYPGRLGFFEVPDFEAPDFKRYSRSSLPALEHQGK